ncbi:MAG: hypothetical protein H7175_03980, partial [Burkholderiales bacterium]|nr:hypothetical protein [Anaerolineae bacterium]
MTDAIHSTVIDAPTALLLRPRLRFLLIVLASAALLLTILLTANYLLERQQLEQSAFDSARSQASAAKQQIDAEFAGVRDTANNIADDLSNGTLAHISADIEARLEAETTANPQINGLGTNFEPFAFSPAERLYQAYRYLDADGAFVTLVHVPYEYTLPEPPPEDTESRHTAWYHEPIDNGARWDEPFLAE